MTERNGFRLAVRTLTGVVLLVSGGYVMVYLYRWEWNRALISGIFFLAAEVGVVTTLLFARLNRLEQALQQAAPVRPDVVAQPPTDPDGESPFAWLDPADGRMGVFVPLLMGAGVLLSAIAFVIEKASGAVARVSSGRAPVAVPGLLPSSSGFLAAPPPATAPRPRSWALSAVFLATAILAFPVIGLIGDATQTRPDPDPDRTTIEVDVRVRDVRESAAEEAAALPAACKGKLSLDRIDVSTTGPGRAKLVVSGVIGESQRRRFTGCLQDATLDGVQATVGRISTEPPERGPAA